MAPLPLACSACRRPFSTFDHCRRLVVLESNYALCGECEWTAAHPEARTLPRPAHVPGRADAAYRPQWQPA